MCSKSFLFVCFCSLHCGLASGSYLVADSSQLKSSAVVLLDCMCSAWLDNWTQVNNWHCQSDVEVCACVQIE